MLSTDIRHHSTEVAVDLKRNASTSSLGSQDLWDQVPEVDYAQVETPERDAEVETPGPPLESTGTPLGAERAPSAPTFTYGSYPESNSIFDCDSAGDPGSIGSGSEPIPSSEPFSTGASSGSDASLGKHRREDDDNDASPKRARLSEVLEPEDPVVLQSNVLFGYTKSLPWGIQWEILRYASAGMTFDIPDVVALRDCDSESAGPRVTEIVKTLLGKTTSAAASQRIKDAFRDEIAAKSPWHELSREEAALEKLRRHRQECKGCETHHLYLHGDDEDRTWYGGKVHFTARLKLEVQGARINPSLELDRPVLGHSTRFSRRFGSSAFIRVRIGRSDVFQHGPFLLEYFKRPFVVNHKVFRAFYSKEHVVFLVRTNEEVFDPTNKKALDRTLRVREPEEPSEDLSFIQFLDWHNSLDLNNKQTMAKWAARFALGLSNSVPGILLRKEDVHRIGDDVSPRWSRGYKDTPTEMIMTDGCGLANARFFQMLQSNFKWSSYPTAIQLRINGAKGLIILHPKHKSIEPNDRPQVWIRDSQAKINYASNSPYDRALYTVDVLRSSHMATPSHLSVETIINLAENNISEDVFTDLMKLNLRERVDKLTLYDPRKLELLWNAVARAGGVFGARLARESTGSARCMGYVYEDRAPENEEDGDEDGIDQLDAAAAEQSIAWWWDPIGGSPSSLEETALLLLDSGFTPENCAVLRAKLSQIAKSALKSSVNKYRLSVRMSCSAFVIPDPTHTLNPGEVHIRMSAPRLIDQSECETDIILGDVLLTRHPCKVPTDVQRAKAVSSPELRNYCDVIVVSSKGHMVNGEMLERHLASMTGGGDYDGDLMQAFWQPELVKQFRAADKHYADEPKSLAACLSKTNETVSEFQDRIRVAKVEHMTYTAEIHELQKYLLSSLRAAQLVGKYSTWWEYSIYKNGYFHEETILLANIFCKVLDGGKTGITIDRDRLKQDSKSYNVRAPAYKETDKEAKADMTNRPNLGRGRSLGLFIMDKMKRAVKAEHEQQLAIIGHRLGDSSFGSGCEDIHLIRPWQQFNERPGNEEAKKAIKDHIHHMHSQWKSKVAPRTQTFTDLPITTRQDILRSLSQEFAAQPIVDITIPPDGHVLAHLKASYAYVYDCELHKRKGWSRFPWDVAFRSLCEIKANALGPTKTVQDKWYWKFNIKSCFLREDSSVRW